MTDVIDVVVEEATEDAHRIAAVEPLEESYLDTQFFTLVWKRAIWLVVLFVAAILTAWALTNYEGNLDAIPWLVLFIPLVISSGGNSGSQSATLIIRALTVWDIRLADWSKVVGRELLMGLLLGSLLGLLGLVIAPFLDRGYPIAKNGHGRARHSSAGRDLRHFNRVGPATDFSAYWSRPCPDEQPVCRGNY